VWQAAGIIVPVIIGWIIDDGITAGDRRVVWTGVAVIVGAGALEAIGAAFRHRAACTADELGKVTMRDALVAAAVADERGPAAELSPGELLGRATGDVEELGSFLDAVSHTVAHLVAVPAVVVVLAFIDWPLALVVGVLVPALAVTMWRYSASWEVRSAEVRRAFDATSAASEELVEGFRVTAGLGVSDVMADRCAGRSEVLRAASVRRARLWMLFEPVVEGLSLVAVTVVVWLGGLRVIDGQLSTGALVTAVGLALFLTWPVRTLGERIVTVQMALASAARLAELLSSGAPTLDDDREALPPAGAARPVGVELVDVVVARDGSLVIDRATVRLTPGSFAVLTGEVGAGKSTLLAALSGEISLGSGVVRLGGVDVGEWSGAARRRAVIRVGPAPFLFAGSIADNVRFGAPYASDGDVQRTLVTADAIEFVDALPDGVDTVLGERGITLSGGQRQRLGLARALAAEPDVLLLDGAVSAVDPARELRILAALADEYRDRLVVVVTTHPDAGRLATVHLDLAHRSLVVR
jgi:ABC-type multidrug transport system fused ATPase/permease subunit